MLCMHIQNDSRKAFLLLCSALSGHTEIIQKLLSRVDDKVTASRNIICDHAWESLPCCFFYDCYIVHT